MIDIDDDINLDDIWDEIDDIINDIWMIFGWNLMKFGWYLGEIDDIYTCVVIHGGLYMGVFW